MERTSTAPRLSDGAHDFLAGPGGAADLRALLGPAASAGPSLEPPVDPGAVRAVLRKSLELQALTVAESALLLRVTDPDLQAELFAAAHTLKERVYGNRIVLFAPLYVGNRCRNECTYCAFRASNRAVERRTLEGAALRAEVRALTRVGHKRLILVFGEHPRYDAEFLAESVRTVYAERSGTDEIRRVNLNAAPLDHEGFRTVKAAGIGTYQIFQETYDRAVYARVHPARGGPRGKSDWLWRLDGPARAIEAGCDDVGIGALFGLADWRFETLALVAHANDLRARYGVGPHTVSFPRLRPALGVAHDPARLVSDADFHRLVAVLRLAIPYTGLILTAREPAPLRRAVMALGVSQIDAGSRIELGGYAGGEPDGADRADAPDRAERADPVEPCPDEAAPTTRAQFALADTRPLDVVMRELMEDGYLPSFCTACYRKGRTGEHFMEFAIPGFIKRYCSPNAVLTLAEYLADYAGTETRATGERLVAAELERLAPAARRALEERLRRVREDGERDVLV